LLAKKIASEMIFLLQPCKIKNESADLHEPKCKEHKKPNGGDSRGSKKEKG